MFLCNTYSKLLSCFQINAMERSPAADLLAIYNRDNEIGVTDLHRQMGTIGGKLSSVDADIRNVHVELNAVDGKLCHVDVRLAEVDHRSKSTEATVHYATATAAAAFSMATLK